MESIANNVGQQASALKATQRWWVVAIEGIAALVIGIYIVANPSNASDIIRILIALALLVVSAGQIADGFRSWGSRASPWATLTGGVGLTAAALALLAGWSSYSQIPPAGARQILALGLIAFGVIGLAALIVATRATGFTIAPLIVDVVAIALGILLFTAEADDTRGTQTLGIVAIVGGVALLIYGYILWSKTRSAS